MSEIKQSVTETSVRVGPCGLLLSGEAGGELPLLGGAMHYFHLPPASWNKCLDAFVELGIPIVDTYVPWSVHELAEGEYDFEGRHASQRYSRDLGAFLTACAQHQLKVLLRPGPHVNAELTFFGFPERVLADPRCQARGARGNPVILPVPPRFFPVPSYASERFLEQAEAWLAAFSRFVADYVWPRGPVIAAQVDNEMSHFFRTAAYDQDYHPDAVTLYRRFLAERYGDQRPPGYGSLPLEEIEPPRAMQAQSVEELLPHLDWVAFKEWMIRISLSRLAEVMRREGLGGVPLTHNLPMTPVGEAASIAKLERELDIAGLDFYLPKRNYPLIRRSVQSLCGKSRLPTVCELGWGGWLWWFPQTIEDQTATALTAMMHGVRGFSLYMLVERDRWYGAPIGPDGARRPERFDITRRLVEAFVASKLSSLHRKVEVGVVQIRDYRRLAVCTSLIDPLPPMALSLISVAAEEITSNDDFGLESSPQAEHARYEHQIEDVLSELRVPYHFLDSVASAQQLQRYRLLLVPTFDFVDPDLLDRLEQAIEAGCTVIIGPRRPSLDRAMRPLRGGFPGHALATHETIADLLADVVEKLELDDVPYADGEGIEIAYYQKDEDWVVFLANQSDTSRTTAIRGLDFDGRWVWDAMSHDPVNPTCVHLEGQQVRMLHSRPAATGPLPKFRRPKEAR